MPKRIKTFDLNIIIIPIIFLSVSVAVIYSLVLGTSDDGLVLKQGVIGLIGIVLMFVFSILDYRSLRGASWIFFIFCIALLLWVEQTGKVVNGAGNWIDLKFFQLQPSELAKLALVIMLASFFGEKINKLRARDFLFSVVLLLVPLVLILREPDLGTGLVLVFIYLVMFLSARPSKFFVFVLGLIVSLLVSVFVLAYLNFRPLGGLLKEYQRYRISVFLNPDLDPYGRGYNVKQAQIAIGSGGVLGKGLGRGSQSQLQFLPEPHTDFIFAGISESFGFVGSFLILVLYCYFLLRLLEIARLARDNFGALIVLGMLAMFFAHVVVNVGMNVGLLPVTGIPLPLLSYGGTSLLVSFIAIGLAESIYIRHKKINF